MRRQEDLTACIDLLLEAGATARYNAPAVLTLLRGKIDELAAQLAAEPALLHRRFPELDFGTSGARCSPSVAPRCCTSPPNTETWLPRRCCSNAVRT